VPLIPPIVVGARDGTCYLDMAARIGSVAAFGEGACVVAGSPDAAEFTARPLCLVIPGDYDQLDDADESDPADHDGMGVRIPRHCTFQIVLVVKDEEVSRRSDELDRLVHVIHNAVDGQSLAGASIPGLSRIRRGGRRYVRHPDEGITLFGEFTFFIEGFGAHDTTPNY
jgi:hypothetical protein